MSASDQPIDVRREARAAQAKSARKRPVSGAAPRLYQRAFDILVGRIADGTIPVDTQLSESSVAAQFGISRPPARRALAELERVGLVEKAKGRGYFVRAGLKAKAKAEAKVTRTTQAETRLAPLSTWERIYADVEGEIIARISFAPWRVNEAHLARYYEVSRTVARDVVGRLQQRGLVRKDARGRWYAPALTPDYIDELYELRWVLEPLALVKAAPRVSPQFIQRMRINLQDATENARRITGTTLDALEEEMHVALLRHCGQRALMQAITLSQSLLIAHRFLYRWTPRLFDTEPFLPEHMEIVQCLEVNDVDRASRALEQHLRVSRDRAVARVDAVVRKFRPDDLPYLTRLDLQRT